MKPLVDLLRIAFALFALVSLWTSSWVHEARSALQQQGLERARMLKVGSWVQAAWLYGLPAWLLWQWPVGLLIWVVMGLKLASSVSIAEGQVRAERRG